MKRGLKFSCVEMYRSSDFATECSRVDVGLEIIKWLFSDFGLLRFDWEMIDTFILELSDTQETKAPISIYTWKMLRSERDERRTRETAFSPAVSPLVSSHLLKIKK